MSNNITTSDLLIQQLQQSLKSSGAPISQATSLVNDALALINESPTLVQEIQTYENSRDNPNSPLSGVPLIAVSPTLAGAEYFNNTVIIGINSYDDSVTEAVPGVNASGAGSIVNVTAAGLLVGSLSHEIGHALDQNLATGGGNELDEVAIDLLSEGTAVANNYQVALQIAQAGGAISVYPGGRSAEANLAIINNVIVPSEGLQNQAALIADQVATGPNSQSNQPYITTYDTRAAIQFHVTPSLPSNPQTVNIQTNSNGTPTGISGTAANGQPFSFSVTHGRRSEAAPNGTLNTASYVDDIGNLIENNTTVANGTTTYSAETFVPTSGSLIPFETLEIESGLAEEQIFSNTGQVEQTQTFADGICVSSSTFSSNASLNEAYDYSFSFNNGVNLISTVGTVAQDGLSAYAIISTDYTSSSTQSTLQTYLSNGLSLPTLTIESDGAPDIEIAGDAQIATPNANYTSSILIATNDAAIQAGSVANVEVALGAETSVQSDAYTKNIYLAGLGDSETGSGTSVSVYADNVIVDNTTSGCTDGIHCSGDMVNGTGETVEVDGGSSVTVDGSDNTTSALTHTDRADSLSSLARIEVADAVQTNGFGSALCSVR